MGVRAQVDASVYAVLGVLYYTRWNTYIEYKVQPCHPVAHGGASVPAEPCLLHMYYAFMSYVGLMRAERVMLGDQAVARST